MDFNNLRVAIVYDRVNKWGGAERVLLSLHEIFPKADLFTSVYDQKKAYWANIFPNVYTSFLQRIPFARSHHQFFAYLMPIAFEYLNFDNYDLVISVTSEAAKGIITKPKTKHICYMLTPTRYLWSHYDIYFKDDFLKFISKPMVNYLRFWDKMAAFRPDGIIAISEEVKTRIKKFYGIDSGLVYPPYTKPQVSSVPGRLSFVDGVRPKDYYLVVSRLEPYKRVDLAIEVFNKLEKDLVIIGTGSQINYLKKIAGPKIHFLGFLDDSLLSFYYQNAKALVMPQEEDFGLVSLEAQGFGVPVIAYGKGGASETVLDGKTGVLFDRQEVVSLVDAFNRFVKMNFNSKDFEINVQRFSFENFKKLFLKEIEKIF
jgi:glycosyltransferase involved in cell wall biosynthesis